MDMNRASKELLPSFHKSLIRYHLDVATRKFSYQSSAALLPGFFYDTHARTHTRTHARTQ